MPQRIGHAVLTLAGRQFQNPHVDFVSHLLRVLFAEDVVGNAESAGGKHLFAVFVVREGARLTNQRIDDVAIIDRRLLLANQSRHGLNQTPLVRHRDLFGTHPHIHRLTDQSAGNGIRVGADLNRAAAADAHAVQMIVRVEAFLRQPLQTRLFFEEPLRAMGVGAGDDLFHEAHILVAAGKVATATQQQRLIHTIFEMSVGRLHIAVFVGAPGIRAFRFAAVMIHQRRITIRQRLAAGMIADRRGQRIRTVPLRHSAELPERFLDALAERLERFRKTQRDTFHVAVSQHAVKQRVIESLAGDRHAQLIAHGEVARRQSSRPMNLAEEHRLPRPVQAAPSGHASLERATR